MESKDLHMEIYNLSYEEKVEVISKFKGDIMQHFKGDFYLIQDIAKLEGCEEKVVVYKALFGDCGIYVRKLIDFFDWIEDNPDRQTQNKMRFEPVAVTSRVPGKNNDL